jgi:hypothetical protein
VTSSSLDLPHTARAAAAPRRLRVSVRWLPAAALVVLPFVVYRQLLGSDRAPGDFDAFSYMYPYRHYLVEAWSSGRLIPLWNPSIFMGAPFLANIQTAVLYPLTLVFLAVPGTAALGWSMAIHLAIAGLGMFLFGLRSAGLRLAGALVAAGAYVLGSHLTVHLAQINQISTFAWTPWLMLAFDRAAVRPRPRLVAAIAALAALTVLAGHTQQAYLTFVAAGLAGLIGLWPHLRAARWRMAGLALGTWLAGGLLGAGIAAAQLLPTAELTRQSYRQGGLSLAEANVDPLPLRGLLGSFLPHYSGPLPPEYAGASAATVVLLLAAFAVLARWRRPQVAFWAVVTLLVVWASTGPAGLLFSALFKVVPGLDLFRAPGRLLLISTIGIAILAGWGVRTIQQLAAGRRHRRTAGRGLLALVATGAGAAILVGLILAGRLPGVDGLRTLRFLPAGVPDRDVLLLSLFAVATIGAMALALRSSWRPAVSLAAAALVLLAFGDSFLATNSYHTRGSIPASLYTETPPVDRLVPPGLDQRYISLATITSLSDWDRLQVAHRPNLGMGDGRLSADGYDGGLLPTAAYVRFRKPLLGPGSANAPDVPILGQTGRVWDPSWLSQAGVGAVLADAGSDPNPPGCRCLRLEATDGGISLWLPVDAQSTRAWVEGAAGQQAARVAEDTGERVVVALPSGAGGRLVLADAYYPGWSATVDGRPATVVSFRDMLRAVDVPAGARSVVFVYQPTSFRVGLAISGAALLVTVLIVLMPAWRRLFS